jgi:hypothetical protein
MPGLVPGIPTVMHWCIVDRDGRDKPGYDVKCRDKGT